MKYRVFVGLYLLCLLLLLIACTRDSGTSAPAPADDAIPTGKLVFIQFKPEGQNLVQFDLRTKQLTTLFTVPELAWLSHADVSPDGNQVVMAYAPPPSDGQVQFGYSSLYLILADGATEPRLLFNQNDPEEIFFNPVWSADGQYIYYSHVTFTDELRIEYRTTLERINFLTHQVDVLVENGIWPRLSSDGQKLAYVQFENDTLKRSLHIADADGANARLLVPADAFEDVDAPLFSPDGLWVYFGAVPPAQAATLSWFDRLLGVKSTSAHDVPSDWWRVPLAGGAPEQITSIRAIGMYGDFVGNGRYMVFAAQTGLYLMNPDGTNLTSILETTAASSLAWGP